MQNKKLGNIYTGCPGRQPQDPSPSPQGSSLGAYRRLKFGAWLSEHNRTRWQRVGWFWFLVLVLVFGLFFDFTLSPCLYPIYLPFRYPLAFTPINCHRLNHLQLLKSLAFTLSKLLL
jgi:hypothetical protein